MNSFSSHVVNTDVAVLMKGVIKRVIVGGKVYGAGSSARARAPEFNASH